MRGNCPKCEPLDQAAPVGGQHQATTCMGTKAGPDPRAVEAGRSDQRLVSQLSSEGSSFQGAALVEPVGEHSAMASVFMRMVISAYR